MIRLIFLLRRKPTLSLAEFQRYWREEHGPLVAGHAGHIRALRYVQVHRVAGLAPGGAGLELGAVGHHHVDHVVVGMNAVLHGEYSLLARNPRATARGLSGFGGVYTGRQTRRQAARP